MPDIDPTDLRRCGVYAIRSADKMYIGSSVDISTRFIRHRYHLRKGDHVNQYLQNAWNKYGEEAFEFVVLEECPVDQLLDREQHYLDCSSEKYNILSTAGSQIGYKHTPEAIAKISATHKGKVVSEETRKKIGDANRGRKRSAEARERMSVSHRGRITSEETREKLRVASTGNKHMLGHKHKPGTIEKMRAAALKRKARKLEEQANDEQ